jgi:hypothetical protein
MARIGFFNRRLITKPMMIQVLRLDVKHGVTSTLRHSNRSTIVESFFYLGTKAIGRILLSRFCTWGREQAKRMMNG